MRNCLVCYIAILALFIAATGCAPKNRGITPEPGDNSSKDQNATDTSFNSDPDGADSQVPDQLGASSGVNTIPVPENPDGAVNTDDSIPSSTTNGSPDGTTQTPPNEPQNVPEGWPEYIFIPTGMIIRNPITHENGGIQAMYTGQISLDSVRSFYDRILDDWETGDMVPIPSIGNNKTMGFFKYRGDETLMLEGTSDSSENPTSSITLSWNRYTSPDKTAEGWPDDIPRMEGLEILYSYTDENGWLVSVLKSSGELEAIGAWYIDHLTGWKSEYPEGTPIISGGMLIMSFEREGKNLSLNGSKISDSVYLWIKLNNPV